MSTATLPAIKYKLLVRTKEDGYIYLGSDFKLYFCDHSGDDRYGEPHGPDACEGDVSPLVVNLLETATYMVTDDARGYRRAFCVYREDGKTTLITERIFDKLKEIVKVLRLA